MYYFIVNPNAHCGLGGKVWKKLEGYMQYAGVEYQAFLTAARGDAARFAAELTKDRQDPCTIVAVGGDGTVNEVLNGLHLSSKVSMGYIPAGSGNDLARGLGLPRSKTRCLKRLLEPQYTCSLDYGIVSYEAGQPVHRRFAVSCGIGLDAAVCHDLLDLARQRGRHHIRCGRLSYLLIGVKQLVLSKPSAGYLVLDGVKKVEFNHIHFVASHIHPYEGGGFQFAPKANSENGELEVCVVHGASKWKLVPIIFDAWAGRLGHHRGVRYYRCKEVQVHVDRPLPVHADGESCYCQTDIHLRCVEKKLRMIV